MRFSQTFGILSLGWMLTAGPAHADGMIELTETGDSLSTTRAVFTSDVVSNILASGNYESEELTDAEARALALKRGLDLPAAGDDDNYGRPWVIVKAGVGLPNLIGAYIEVFVHRNWTVELGVGAGLLPTVFEGSIRWRPDATCWDCDGDNFFSIGFGIDPGVYFGGEGSASGSVGVMVTATVDLMYIHRFSKHFGIMVGSRLGAGVVTEFNGSDSWTGIEPTLKINLLQVGFVF